MDGPMRQNEAELTVWKLSDTTTSCDECPRPARYAVYSEKVDRYLCRPHAINEVAAEILKMKNVRVVA